MILLMEGNYEICLLCYYHACCPYQTSLLYKLTIFHYFSSTTIFANTARNTTSIIIISSDLFVEFSVLKLFFCRNPCAHGFKIISHIYETQMITSRYDNFVNPCIILPSVQLHSMFNTSAELSVLQARQCVILQSKATNHKSKGAPSQSSHKRRSC